ncbi:hypothetical protein CHCC20335_0723 [Bacillus paralicheniformis]|nr:hypothetical protein CHCC20335_0723 [Bacillus paralicheniformis]
MGQAFLLVFRLFLHIGTSSWINSRMFSKIRPDIIETDLKEDGPIG